MNDQVRPVSQAELHIVMATVLSAALMVSWVYFSRVEFPHYAERLRLHTEVLLGIAETPYRHRVLVPYLAEGLIRLLTALRLQPEGAFYCAYFLINAASLTSFLGLTYAFFKQFYSARTSLIGILFISCMIHICLQNHYYQPWSILEGAFFTAALLMIYKNQIRWLPILTAVATLNRETGILIPALLAVHQVNGFRVKLDRFILTILLMSGALSILVFGVIRYIQGGHEDYSYLWIIFNHNTAKYHLARAAINISMLLGFWWAILLINLRHNQIDVYLRKSWRILWAFIPMMLIFGIWAEVRLFLPLYALATACCLPSIEALD